MTQSVMKSKNRKSPTEDQMIRREAALLHKMMRRTEVQQIKRMRFLRLTDSSRFGRVLVGAPEGER